MFWFVLQCKPYPETRLTILKTMKGRWMLYVGGIWGVGLLAKYCPCNSITHQVSPQREHHPCKKTKNNDHTVMFAMKPQKDKFVLLGSWPWISVLIVKITFNRILCLCYCVFILGFISLWWFVPLCLPNMTPLSIFNETEWKIIGVCCSHQEHGGQLNRLPAHQMVRGAASIICYKSKHKLL